MLGVMLCSALGAAPDRNASDLHPEQVTDMLRDACGFYDLIRTRDGYYLDLLNLEQGSRDHRASSASTGVGLVALCVAHEMKFDPDAERKALQTLEAIQGIEQNVNGFRAHWFDTRTGRNTGPDGFSTIDTALLVAGVLFCRNTFPEHTGIHTAAKTFWESIRWETAKVDELRYELVQQADGIGGQHKTRLFNEYLLLADYCSHAAGEAPFSDWDRLQRAHYGGSSALAGNPSHFLPLFTFQFPLYLSPVRTRDQAYWKECMQAGRIDRMWWAQQPGIAPGIWGSTAGTGLQGYSVDATKRNQDLIASAPSVVGFIPLVRKCEDDFRRMVTQLPRMTVETGGLKLYWRASVRHTHWKPTTIQGIDFSPMLFGLAAHPHALGFEFFQDRSRIPFPAGTALASDNR